MAENQKVIKIKELPDITNIEDTDILVIEDRNTTRKASAQDIVGYIKNHKAISDYYVQQSTVDAANGLAALNADKKIKSENIPFGNTVNTVFEGSSGKALESSLDAHILDKDNPHGTTKQQIGLSNVDNTSDRNKPVSTAQQAAIDLAYQNATGYADRVKSDIMGGIPESTLDTIVELGEALKDSEDALTTLIETVGTKAPQTELDSHASNNVIHVTSTNKSNWTDAYNKRHEHSNKTVLDGITTALITAWNNAVTHISDTVKHITAAERTAWNDAASKKHTHSNKPVLDGITSALVAAWNSAKTHADSPHAPSNAEKNIIAGMQKNGTDISVDPSTRKVNIAVPTKVSELTNDAGYKTTDNNTTYSFSVSEIGAENGNAKLRLTGSDSSTEDVLIKGSGASTVTTDASGNIVVSSANTTYGAATSSANGLMSSSDKVKLNGIASGAQVNTITGIKGNAETVYRTGNINLTPANIGLGNVANVTPNNQTITYSETKNLTQLSSGEALSVAFGKIAKAVTDFISHVNDTVKHVTNSEKTNWNAAYDHSQSAHAPSNAQANQNAFSKIAVGSTTVEADNATDTLTLAAGSNITITPDATNDKLTITAKDTVYTHPSNTAYSNGLYKVTVDALGHVTSAVAVSKADITGLGIPSADTNTHYASKNVVGSSTATSNTTTALTNGNVYLLSVENGVVTSAHQIKGTGGCTVTTDASGNILINGANTYTLPTATGSVLGGVKTGANITNTSGVISLTKANVVSALGYTPGTSSADPITVDSELSATSVNPVENKAVYAALEDKSHFSSAPANGQVVIADGTAGAIKTSGYTIAASVPSGAKFTDTVYTHPATAGNKHIPGGGSSGQILRWSSAGTAAWGADNNSDTKNTAGSTNTSSKLFLVGATSQAANPQTYSHDTAYVGEDGCLYSNNKKVSVDGHTHPYAGSGSAGGAATTALACTGNSATATKWATPRNVNGLSMDGTSNLANYTSCSTAAGTAAKSVSCTGFALMTGAEITVKFTATNTAGSPTLNVNNTGAKPIYYRGSAISAGYLAANRTYTFRYNGTQYDLVGDINIDTNNAVTQTISNTANANYRILFSNTADDATRTEGTRKDTNLTYNPSTNTLNVVNVNGTASKAIGDANGNTIINEIVSDTEPANQKAGDFWLKEY